MVESNGWGFWKEESLRSVAGQFSNAAETLQGGKNPQAPDCGDSSEIVSDLIGRLVGAEHVSSVACEAVSGAINAADGTYGNVENSSAGEMKLVGLRNEGKLPEVPK